MAANPGVEVKLEAFPWDVFIQTIHTSIPAGNTADVIQIAGGYTCRYALGGQLLEVPAEMMALEQAEEIFFAAPLGGQVCNGKLYGFPAEYTLEYGGTYVNQALFEAASLAYPPAWASWAGVVADAQKLVEYNDDGSMRVAGLHYTNNDQLYYENAFVFANNLGLAAAMSMILFMVILVFTVIQFRMLRSEWEYECEKNFFHTFAKANIYGMLLIGLFVTLLPFIYIVLSSF